MFFSLYMSTVYHHVYYQSEKYISIGDNTWREKKQDIDRAKGRIRPHTFWFRHHMRNAKPKLDRTNKQMVVNKTTANVFNFLTGSITQSCGY